jgi:hypothetical protein
MTASQFSTGMSANAAVRWMPASLTSTSIGDHASIAAIIVAIAAGSRRSASKCRTSVAPASRTAAIVASICSGVPRPLIATRAPAAPNARAIASPMPDVLPVTRAVRWLRKRSFIVGTSDMERYQVRYGLSLLPKVRCARNTRRSTT